MCDAGDSGRRNCAADRHRPFLCWCQYHRLLRLLRSKFPVSHSEPGDHMRPRREWFNDHLWLCPLKGKCHDWTKNDDGIGNRLAGQLTACDGCAGSRRRWRRRRIRGRWRLQRRFHGWLRRRSWWRLWRRPCWRLRRKSHGWLRRNSHGGHGPRSRWLWKTWFRRLLRRQLSVLHVIRLVLHLLSGDPIRKLPARGFEILEALTWRNGEPRNASSSR